MSIPKHLLTARAEGRNVLVSCVGGISCCVYGTTIPVSVVLGKEGASFTTHLPEGAVDDGLVAVALYNGKRWVGGVLAVTADADGHAHADLEHSWVPNGKLMVHVEYSGVFVTDVAFGMRFTTSQLDAKDGWTHVPDGNLLIRYVAGTATIDEVRQAAQAQAEEKSARERLAEIEPELARVEALATEAGVAVADLGTEYRRLKEVERRARALREEMRSGEATTLPTDVAAAYLRLNVALDE